MSQQAVDDPLVIFVLEQLVIDDNLARMATTLLPGNRLAAEVEFKRKILDQHRPIQIPVLAQCSEHSAPSSLQKVLDCPDCKTTYAVRCMADETEWPCAEARALVCVYADAEDFREEWAGWRNE